MPDLLQLGGDAFYRQLFEHAGVPLIATDRELTIRLWNPATARMFGAGADQMIGTSLVSVIPRKQRDEAERSLRRVIEKGQIEELGFQYRDVHGEQRELMVTISPIVSEGGERIGALAGIRDITRRIKLESEIHQKRKMASLGEMAGAFSHYFNNILGGIITSVDYANVSTDFLLKSRVLEQTGRALSRATELMQSLLSFAEGDLQAEDLSDFCEIVNSIADEVEPRTKQLGVDLHLSLSEVPVLAVPRAQVTTVFRNVVENAIDAMPEGGTLSIDASLNGDWLNTCISDTGRGLDEQALSRVFEPFWSTKAPTSTPGGRAPGLGLAIAHKLLEVLGGTISVSSTAGEGCRFTISLPLSKQGQWYAE